jgi:hypothetical protein
MMSSTQSHKSTLPNSAIGLNSDNISDSNINSANWRFLKFMREAPVPKRTIGKPTTMRERILQISLFPDIYDKRGKSRSPGNVDFGEPHAIKDNPY